MSISIRANQCCSKVYFVRLVALAVVFATGYCSSRTAIGEAPVDAIEKLAFEIDSATGLLTAQQPQKFLGARSCAASACHGGIDPDPRFPLSRRNEFIHWIDHDPHARSYRTLLEGSSKKILARLARSTDDDAARAKRLANCMGCHNPQPAGSKQGEKYYARDGVSCEICHGPAEKWVERHVTADWPRLRATGDAAGLGFIDTENITVRAQTCVACHVGSPGREVNHDLIAAGHPALKFELTAYHAMLPKHWRGVADQKKKAELELALWSDGQVACGEAALELLASRARRAKDKHPDAVWPEFAEYDCFACHHDLVDPSWRQTVPKKPLELGLPAWGSWYFSRLKPAGGANLALVADTMQGNFHPDPKTIAAAAKAVQLTAPQIDAAVSLPVGWDDATQQYLALVARRQALLDARDKGDDKDSAAKVEDLREALAYTTDYNSPKQLSEMGDKKVTREEVQKLLSDLLNLLNELQQGGDE